MMMRSCSAALAAVLFSIGLAAGSGASAEEAGVWRPACICKSGVPDSKTISAVFIITEANSAALRKNIEAGLLGLDKHAKLLGKSCGKPKMCGTARGSKTKKRYPNTPIAGPVTIRISFISSAPINYGKASKDKKINEKLFKIGRKFKIGGKPVK